MTFCQSSQRLLGRDMLTTPGTSTKSVCRVYARLAKETGAPNDLIDILRSVSTLRLFELPLWEDPTAVPSIRATLSLLDTILETWGAKST